MERLAWYYKKNSTRQREFVVSDVETDSFYTKSSAIALQAYNMLFPSDRYVI